MPEPEDEIVEQMSERLDELEKKIADVKHQAMADDLIDDPDEPRYYESGSIGADQDDQEIAPPG